MATAPVAKSLPAVSCDIFLKVLTLNFSDGRTLEVDTATLPATILHEAMMQGLKKKLVDGAALACSTVSGRSASIADKYDGVKEIFDRLTSGPEATWNKVRGSGDAGAGLFLRAMMKVTGKSRQDADTAIAAFSKEQLAALKKNPRILAVMEELRPVDTSIDTDSLLDGLMAGEEEEEVNTTIDLD
jgi:hypothetical protein